MKRLACLLMFLGSSFCIPAQNGSAPLPPVKDSTKTAPPVSTDDCPDQRDVIDIYHTVVYKLKLSKTDKSIPCDTVKKTGKLHLSFLPGFGYALQTRFAGAAAANGAFYLSEGEHANLSVVNALFVYSENHQLIIPVQSNIWTKGNKFNLQGDWRYYQYPQYTYGLGGHSSLNNADLMNYSYVTVHQTIVREIAKEMYFGPGYDLDYHWNISETGLSDGSVTDFQRYGKSPSSLSSGFSLHFLYDDRRNAINPPKGSYLNVVYRVNSIHFGSDNDWQSVVVDARKYFKLSQRSNNVLAFWGYFWLTFNGNPPYLDLPSTAWDTYSNMGRGYIQSRFRGKNLMYLESEYRFGLTRNGLFGGVVFLNAQSVSEWPGNNFEVISPGAGIGLRMKVNKHSNTNIALDYGWGLGGSNGLFINLGEVF